MTGRNWLDRRLDVSWRTGALAVGDFLALAAFVAIGQAHHTGANPLAAPVELLGSLAPFLLGWLLVALIGGLYTHDALLGPRRMLSWTVPAWILGALLALALRWTALFPGNVRGLFPFVAVGFGGLVVVGWRTVAAVALSRPE